MFEYESQSSCQRHVNQGERVRERDTHRGGEREKIRERCSAELIYKLGCFRIKYLAVFYTETYTIYVSA